MSADASFAASCTAPRAAVAIVLLDAENPLVPTAFNEVGYIYVEDKGVGAVTRRVSAGPFPGSLAGLTQAAPLASTTRKFDILLAGSSCSSGSGVNISGAMVEVLGTKAG